MDRYWRAAGVGAAALLVILAGVFLAGLVLAAAARAVLGDDAEIDGTVVLAPTCRSISHGESECTDRPVATDLEVASEGGEETHRVRSDQNGHFTVSLSRSGSYTIHELPHDELIWCDGSGYVMSPTKLKTPTTVVCHYGPR